MAVRERGSGRGGGAGRGDEDEAAGAQGGLGLLRGADTIVVPGYVELDRRPPEALLEALRTAACRGARIISICTGAFTAPREMVCGVPYSAPLT